jgi:hypothetical protein
VVVADLGQCSPPFPWTSAHPDTARERAGPPSCALSSAGGKGRRNWC